MNTAAPRLPSVDKLLQTPVLQGLQTEFGRSSVTNAVRQVLDTLRLQLRDGSLQAEQVQETVLTTAVQQRLTERFAPRLKSVFNLTGTVLHTNLGRALLPQEAVDAVVEALTNPANLEYDLETGGRGDRDDLVEQLICELTGAEAATIVNNNAAAVLLTLSTLAPGKEVVVSRGELVEIGGAFRIPDIMKRAGCQLVEVGTTNRTHAKDYAEAVTENTALLMKVHTSNYEVVGFTKSVSDAEVTAMAHERGLNMIVDLGSGTLVDLRDWGLPHEVTVRETVEAGADVVTYTRGLTNDVYFQVGLLTTVGLASKNAILIVEFAVQLQEQGKNLFDATVEAVRMRLRPILMTSLAFGFGVIPLALGTGAGAGGRNSIGTAVLGGTVASTVLGLFMVPVFFLLIRSWFKSRSRNDDTPANTQEKAA